LERGAGGARGITGRKNINEDKTAKKPSANLNQHKENSQ
jgi:hypothetical protein